jgi:hypothetical protein
LLLSAKPVFINAQLAPDWRFAMSKQPHDTPMLDQLESGPWPSFVTGLKRLAKDNDYMTDLMGQLEHSYKTRKGYWKGGTVGVFGYGGGVIPRFSEVAEMFPASKEFHTLRIQPPAGMHYDTNVLRKMCDIWEKAWLRPDRLSTASRATSCSRVPALPTCKVPLMN